jgi:hypothetical protein
MKRKEDTLISRLEQIQISEREIALFGNRLATTTTRLAELTRGTDNDDDDDDDGVGRFQSKIVLVVLILVPPTGPYPALTPITLLSPPSHERLVLVTLIVVAVLCFLGCGSTGGELGDCRVGDFEMEVEGSEGEQDPLNVCQSHC